MEIEKTLMPRRVPCPKPESFVLSLTGPDLLTPAGAHGVVREIFFCFYQIKEKDYT